MRKYIILFFLVLTFLFACNKTPDGIIEPGEMTELLTDMHIADGSIMNVSQVPDSLYKYATGRYLEIFKRYHTDSTQFRKSFKYYTTQPAELSTMYDQVIINLTAKMDSVNKLLAKQNASNPHKPVLSTATPGGFMPGGGTGGMPGKSRPPQNQMEARAVFERNKKMSDSIANKFKKMHHALPQK